MTDILENIGEVDMFALAEKVTYNVDLKDEEKDIVADLDASFKQIGKQGFDKEHLIAQFITKTINNEIYDAPDDLLDNLFDRNTIGQFDDYSAEVLPPENTLVAHEAGFGGNVERSFIDMSVIAPIWKNRQVETDISFADIARGGYKTVALLTDYAERALKNAMVYDVFSVVDNGIASGAENYVTETTSMPTQASMDALVLYLMEHSEDGHGMAVGLTKYIQAASKLTGFHSEEMLNELHRNGRLGMYDGVDLFPINSSKKVGGKQLMIPD